MVGLAVKVLLHETLCGSLVETPILFRSFGLQAVEELVGTDQKLVLGGDRAGVKNGPV